MKVLNKTKNTILSEDAQEAKSFKDRTFGLLDPSKPRTLILNTRFGIHTLGMKHAIDVLILDDNGRVVKLKRDMKPGAIFTWKPQYSRVIELPPGTISKTNTAVGDHVEIV
jgi:uncharacterized membrane protein (UPF0127 family)